MPRRSSEAPGLVTGAVQRLAADDPFPGVARQSFQSAQATVASYSFAAGAEFPRHRHDEEQITVVLAGSAEFEVAGERHQLGPGDTYVVAPGAEHGLRAGAEGASFVAIVVPRRERPDGYELST